MRRPSCIPPFLALSQLTAAFASEHRPLHAQESTVHPHSTRWASPASKYHNLLHEHTGGRPAAQLYKVDSQAQVLSQTLHSLLERKQNLTDAVQRKKEMLEAASRQHTSRKKQLDGLIEQSVQLDLKKDALEAKLQQLQRDRATATAGTPKVAFVKSNSMVQLARDLENENSMLQDEIAKNEQRKEKLANDVKEMRERGFQETVNEARTRIHEEQQDLHEFTQKFAQVQTELNKELSTVLEPWAKHWEGQASGREEDEDDELSNLDSQMHMKAYDTIRNFDRQLVNAAREQSCYFDKRMGEQVTALDTVEKTLQPAV